MKVISLEAVTNYLQKRLEIERKLEPSLPRDDGFYPGMIHADTATLRFVNTLTAFEAEPKDDTHVGD